MHLISLIKKKNAFNRLLTSTNHINCHINLYKDFKGIFIIFVVFLI